jgi:hypothetical protein
MRTYIPSPTVTKRDDIPFVTVTIATQVCATEAYSITFPSAENRYIAVLSLHLTDDECDVLVEALAAARAERLAQQEKAYETLQAKFGGSWDNRPAAGFDGEPATDDTDLADGE